MLDLSKTQLLNQDCHPWTCWSFSEAAWAHRYYLQVTGFFMGARWKADSLFCDRFCAVGDGSSKGWIKDPEGAPPVPLPEPAAPCRALPCLQHQPFRPGSFHSRDPGPPELQVGPCAPWGVAFAAQASAEGPGLGAFPRGCCSPPAPETWRLGSILICLHPSSAGSQPPREKLPQLSSEIGPRAPGEGDQMSRFSPAAPALGGESSGHRKALLRQCPPVQMANLEIPPQRRRSVAWEMPIGQICCCRRKTKPLASHAAGDKWERARERPRGGPSGTMAILSGAGDGRPDKGARCPQTPAAASAQNRGEQIWFLSSKSS